jgi:CHAT domain-containing protein
VVASGALAYVPFGALSAPGAHEPLLAQHEVVSAPSASVVIALRQEHGAPAVASPTVGVLADPVFEATDPRVRGGAGSATGRTAVPVGLTRAMDSLGRGGFTRLPFSRGEADAIAAFVPQPALLKATDFAASRALVATGALGDRRVIHFATHGILNSEHPDLSGLVLSLVDETGAPRDGFLRMHEIYNLRLPADLVVLSACQTALGREMRGEGLVGLTRGFMYAGARRVVASLWQVDDESTAELMERFYRAMLKDGHRPSSALRSAQLGMSRSRRWAAPFYWAGFTLQGEWK